MNLIIDGRFGKSFSAVTAIITLLAASVAAQVTSTTSGGRNGEKPDQVRSAEKRIDQITKDSGRYFKQGLEARLSQGVRYEREKYTWDRMCDAVEELASYRGQQVA